MTATPARDRATPDAVGIRAEVTDLLRRLVACDTSNPPGREAHAAAILEDYLVDAGLECERVSKDPERPNLLVRLRGSGTGPSLAFLGHLDVVVARPEDWSVEPFAGIERDGAIWGRGTVDMKCQVAATAVALATLAREGFEPGGDLMLLLVADEEVGDAEVGAPFFVEQRPDLNPDFVIGEGAGERFRSPSGPIYLLDHGVKATASATLTVRGRAGDASLPDAGPNALFETARLLGRLEAYRSPVRIPPEVEPIIDGVAPGPGSPLDRLASAPRIPGSTGFSARWSARRSTPPSWRRPRPRTSSQRPPPSRSAASCCPGRPAQTSSTSCATPSATATTSWKSSSPRAACSQTPTHRCARRSRRSSPNTTPRRA
jgi:hypothetical protein